MSQARRRTIDQMDILREQQKILSEEMALQSKSFKQLSEEATKAPENEEIKVMFSILFHDLYQNMRIIYLPWICAGGDYKPQR